jgi:hypothetical protein
MDLGVGINKEIRYDVGLLEAAGFKPLASSKPTS